jgi:hypothetical protein
MDRDGRVKAWLHPDLSKCLPVGCAPGEDGLRREEALEGRMVEEIVRMVEENTARDGDQGVTVTEYMRRNQRGRGMTFKQAKLEVVSYAEEFQTEIPNYFESVVGIFDEEASEKDEPSAQPPPFLKNDKESDIQDGNTAGFNHEVIDQWQSSHPYPQQQEKTT